MTPKEPSVDEPRLHELLGVWSERLGLQNWRIALRVGGLDDESSSMEVARSTTYERAVIHVAPWLLGLAPVPEDALFGEDARRDEWVEASLVHELLHLYTRDIRAVVRDDLCGQLSRDAYALAEAAIARAEEQCVDRLAEALVRAFASPRR